MNSQPSEQPFIQEIKAMNESILNELKNHLANIRYPNPNQSKADEIHHQQMAQDRLQLMDKNTDPELEKNLEKVLQEEPPLAKTLIEVIETMEKNGQKLTKLAKEDRDNLEQYLHAMSQQPFATKLIIRKEKRINKADLINRLDKDNTNQIHLIIEAKIVKILDAFYETETPLLKAVMAVGSLEAKRTPTQKKSCPIALQAETD